MTRARGRRVWKAGDHPRWPGGGERGGQFREKTGAGGGIVPGLPSAGHLMRARGLGKLAQARGLFGESPSTYELGTTRIGHSRSGHRGSESWASSEGWAGRMSAAFGRGRGEADPRALDGVQVYLAKPDGSPVTGAAEARRAMAEVTGRPYSGSADPGTNDGDWLVTLPVDIADVLVDNGHWEHRRHPGEGGYTAEAEWDSELGDPRGPYGIDEADDMDVLEWDGPPLDRDTYNQHIIDEAVGFEQVNLEGDDGEPGESDEELAAQIQIARDAIARGDRAAADSAIEHLRGMLVISYMDDNELPPRPDDAPEMAGGGNWTQALNDRMSPPAAAATPPWIAQLLAQASAGLPANQQLVVGGQAQLVQHLLATGRLAEAEQAALMLRNMLELL